MPSTSRPWTRREWLRRLTAAAWMSALASGLMACGQAAPVSSGPDATAPPRPLREMRGAWIATVANLDWPSRPGLSSAQQKQELLAILEKAVQLKLNTIILQVRPACDALYPCPLEPWTEFLTGQAGKAPEPFYDPLAFAVHEAHQRGLELHAWFNPFRVRAPHAKSGPATNAISRLHPDWVRSYGSQLWLDPALKAVTEHSTRVILDVVRRYDVDGVHLDDYFYPYPEKAANGQWVEFKDDASWRQYLARGGRLSRADWRRKNIDDFVDGLHRKIKAQKPWVKLGISPFGIWRPGFPAQVKGLDAYDRLYADARKWLTQGWVDYLAPQLYWDIAGPEHSYPVLLEWWVGQNAQGRHVCPANDLTKVGERWSPTEIVDQLRLTRKQRGASGNILWGMASLLRTNSPVAERLASEIYTQPALLPASPWIVHPLPGKPTVQLDPGSPTKAGKLAWSKSGRKEVWLWLVQSRSRGKWTTVILPGQRTTYALPGRSSPTYPDVIALTPINRCSAAGPTVTLATEKVVGALSQSETSKAQP